MSSLCIPLCFSLIIFGSVVIDFFYLQEQVVSYNKNNNVLSLIYLFVFESETFLGPLIFELVATCS